jgi:hypothetical protein
VTVCLLLETPPFAERVEELTRLPGRKEGGAPPLDPGVLYPLDPALLNGVRQKRASEPSD